MKVNSLNITIPYDYANKLVAFTWEDILFGIEEKIFTENVAVQHANKLLNKGEDIPYPAIELSCLKEGESIYPFINDLVKENLSDEDKKIIKNKFMFLLLNWIFENKNSFTDPLEAVEIVYADFDYPEEISKFVRYMPADEPPLDTLEKNIIRLYERWQNYLDKQKAFFQTKIIDN